MVLIPQFRAGLQQALRSRQAVEQPCGFQAAGGPVGGETVRPFH